LISLGSGTQRRSGTRPDGRTRLLALLSSRLRPPPPSAAWVMLPDALGRVAAAPKTGSCTAVHWLQPAASAQTARPQDPRTGGGRARGRAHPVPCVHRGARGKGGRSGGRREHGARGARGEAGPRRRGESGTRGGEEGALTRAAAGHGAACAVHRTAVHACSCNTCARRAAAHACLSRSPRRRPRGRRRRRSSAARLRQRPSGAAPRSRRPLASMRPSGRRSRCAGFAPEWQGLAGKQP
jgi:hypothetical protein